MKRENSLPWGTCFFNQSSQEIFRALEVEILQGEGKFPDWYFTSCSLDILPGH